jgi:uncharacterized Zn finger protein (UPF0148 family)
MARKKLILRANGARCPDCGGPIVHGEGRLRCVICGFMRRA